MRGASNKEKLWRDVALSDVVIDKYQLVKIRLVNPLLYDTLYLYTHIHLILNDTLYLYTRIKLILNDTLHLYTR